MRQYSALSKLPGLAFVMPALLLASWELAARWGLLDPVFFPPPALLARMAGQLWTSGALPAALAATLTRAASGFFPGALAGVVLGIGMGISPAVRRLFEPSLAAIYSMPKLALLPICLLILGVGEASRLALIGLGAFLTMTMQVHDGMRAIDPGYLELARTYGASGWLRWRRVYLPGVLPAIFTGARVSFGRSLVVAISAELVMGSPGLGSMIWLAWQTFSTERLYVTVAAAGLLGLVSQTVLRQAEKRLLPWREE